MLLCDLLVQIGRIFYDMLRLLLYIPPPKKKTKKQNKLCIERKNQIAISSTSNIKSTDIIKEELDIKLCQNKTLDTNSKHYRLS